MQNVRFAVALVVVALLVPSESQLRYMRQKSIIPMTKSLFAMGGLNSDDTKLVMVQKKGDLEKWIETIDGIPVYGTVITTHTNSDGLIDRVEGYTVDKTKKFNPNETFPGSEADDILKIFWKHEGLENVDWKMDPPEKYALQEDDRETKLVWHVAYSVTWKDGATEVKGFGTVPAYIEGLVNAHTGKIERTWNNLQEVAIKAIVGNDKTGMQETTIDVERENYLCYHEDYDRRVRVFTMGNRKYYSRDTVSSFICDHGSSPEWDLHNFTGGYSPRNSAFKHGVQFVDLWRKLVGFEVQPYRTSNSYLDFYVHYGYQLDNAEFRGYFFLIGDGKNKFYPLSCLDVICHEVGHAITTWRGGKMEYWRESGAINEAYSDMLGETCDMYYNKKDDYLIGEDIMKPGEGKAMRDLCNPSKFGGLEHYKEYNNSVNVHYSSGIYNKAWCILSKTKGWDFVMAFQVFTDANLMFWSRYTTMHCGACSVESAAMDRGLSRVDVHNAFKEVGVYCGQCEKSIESISVKL